MNKYDPYGDEFYCRTVKYAGSRNRARLKGYFCCPICDNQFIMCRAYKERDCPICGYHMMRVSVVREFEVEHIRKYAEEVLLEETDKGISKEKIKNFQYAFLLREDVQNSMKQYARKEIRKE